MKTSKLFAIIAWLSACLVPIRTIEVYKSGKNGKSSWQESSQMRDRSVVPTPSLHDKIADYRRRSKIPVPDVKAFRTRSHIPVPESSSYRSPSDDIPRPSVQDIEEDYRRRSGIPFPEKINPLNRRDAAGRRYYNQKKNLINRILFSLPIGAQFPIYFSSQGPSRKGTNKKSDVAIPVRRYRLPYRMQTWGLPKALQSKKYQMPYMEHRAIARQQIIPRQGFPSEFRRRYYTPRPFSTSQLLSNRNVISALDQRNRPYLVPQTRYFLNRITRSDSPVKKINSKDIEQSRKAVINKGVLRK